MYSIGEEFEFLVDNIMENFVCIGTIKTKDSEYIICENDYGIKKAFLFNEDDEELKILSKEDEENVIESYERNELEEEPDYSELYDDYEDDKLSEQEDEFDLIDDESEFSDFDNVDLDLDLDTDIDFDDDDSLFDNIDDFIDDLIDEDEKNSSNKKKKK